MWWYFDVESLEGDKVKEGAAFINSISALMKEELQKSLTYLAMWGIYVGKTAICEQEMGSYQTLNFPAPWSWT